MGLGLQLDQRNGNSRVVETIGIRRDIAHHHGDFIAIHELGATNAVFVDFVGQVAPLRDRETEVAEKTRRSGEQAKTSDMVPSRFFDERFHQRAADATSLSFGKNSDRPDLREMHPVKVKRAAAQDAALLLGNDEVSNVFAELRDTARQERPGISIRLDNGVDLLHVRQNSLPGSN